MKIQVAAVVLIAMGGYASAHEGMHGPGSEFDADADGGLSLQEYTQYLQANKQDVADAAAKFAALDTDKNDMLSSAEFIRGLKKAPAAASKL